MRMITATATEMQNNFGHYLNFVMSVQESIVTKNGKEQFEYIYIGCSFLFSGVKMVMFFLCTVERYSIIKPVFYISLKAIIRKSANQMKVWDAKLQGL